jgi:nucleoside-diphosphate-sugar epimerase
MVSDRGPVVVTGAAGRIGSALVRHLHAKAIPVHPLTRADVDLTDVAATRATFEQLRPRAIVHLAGSLARTEDDAGREAQWRDTFGAGRTVIDAAVAAGVGHLIIPGTLDELGLASGVLDTATPAHPCTTYGLCKSLVREVAAAAARMAPVRVDWFRPASIYGEGLDGENIVAYACRAAANREPAQFGDGSHQRDLLHLDDVLAWLTRAVHPAVATGAPGLHLHHLGTGEAPAMVDVLAAIAEELPGARFELGARPASPREPAVRTLPPYRDDHPALDGWRAVVGWADGVRATARSWRVRAPSSAIPSR